MAIRIQAAAVTAQRKVEILPLETSELRYGEALVRVRAVALCTLEQRVFSGVMKLPLPFLGGHEVTGDIAALGPGANPKMWQEGNRVTVRLLYSCGECYYCRTGHTNMCTQAQRKPVREGMLPGPGGLCDYIVVQTKDLYRIPDELSYEEAALTEPLACCVHSVERVDIQFGESVVVIGGGIMGMNHIMLAKRRGARVILSEMDEDRRKLALDLGADIVIDPSGEDPVEKVKKLTEGRGADIVFNTTAIGAVVPQAIEMCGKAGRMVQYSSMHPDAPVQVSPHMLHNSEKILTGSVSPTEQDFFKASRMISCRVISMKRLIAKTYPFAEVQNAFEHACEPGTYRIVVTAG
ncbi:MAG: zinc-binding dehydrogenase [Lachnospiraceae bacterium]|jgi:L-iditol 2-dehydrogenase|nr:zinc-binding dehydrogenase [Lachnospiraceae bacterium]